MLTASKSLRVRVMLSLAYGCGLRAGEVIRLRAGDFDSAQNIVRIVQSKGRKDRHVMLPPCVLALSRQWWLARLADRQQKGRQRQAEEPSTPHRQMQAAVTHGSAGVPDA